MPPPVQSAIAELQALLASPAQPASKAAPKAKASLATRALLAMPYCT